MDIVEPTQQQQQQQQQQQEEEGEEGGGEEVEDPSAPLLQVRANAYALLRLHHARRRLLVALVRLVSGKAMLS
jgi:hypothetical protein